MIDDRFKKEVTILIAEDDDGHAELIQDNLQEAGLRNPIVRFRNGQEALDFFYGASDGDAPRCEKGLAYMMLLDIRMPKVDGVEVLRQIKSDPELKNMPVIMLTTTDDPREVRTCYALGCSCYVTKPVDYQKFAEMLNRLGLFLLVVQVPDLDGVEGRIEQLT
ncbi:response regulator [Oryzomonas sagensis]|uniref:Response regulator n=1 Tax=Oryzomonas sagensis TaxID=2603857 RepID=A0ABQ6TQV7_9BACT|nr:response regulator [Oryzomonas sagensis]KAB0671222.1 response regulator [Oryzomonas sagensis]